MGVRWPLERCPPARGPIACGLLLCTIAVGLTGCGPRDSGRETETDRIMADARPAWCDGLPRPIYATLTRVESGSDWFEVYEVRDGVFAIYEPHQYEEVISYLIVGEKRALLFDTGLGIGRISEVVARLTLLPVTVLNSHTHLDHIGGNAEFDRVAAVNLAFSIDNSRGLPNREVRATLDPERLCAPLPEGVNADSYEIRAFDFGSFVYDGDQFDLGGRTLEVLLTPGHTPDALMLLDRANGLLFTGDSFYEGPIYLFAPETDRDLYRQSIARVAELVPDLDALLPAHNTPISDPALLEEVLAALDAMAAGTAAGEADGEMVKYDFGRFSVLLRPSAPRGSE